MEGIYGIDVSHWQGDIDWDKVAQSGVKFVIIKAGGSDAGFYTDTKFEENYDGAKNSGLAVGAYYYVGPGFVSTEDGIADAERFENIIAGKEFNMPVILDLEETSPEDAEGATDASIAFCDYLRDRGYYVMIYASDISGFKEKLNIDRLSGYDKWVARYGKKPEYVEDYGIWQNDNNGSVYGISERVDIDIAYKDYPSIIAGMSGNEEQIPEEDTDSSEETGDATPVPESITYTIQSGDTLSAIAIKFGTTVEKIVDDNNISNPNLIYAGDTIIIR